MARAIPALAAALVLGACARTGPTPDDARPADVADATPPADRATADRSDANDLPQPEFVPWDPGVADPVCDPSGWCWEHPSPAGGEVASVASSGPDDAWALTREGILLHASPRGLEALRAHPYDPALASGSVWSASPTEAWVAFPGALLRWDGTAFRRAVFYGGLDQPTRVWGTGPRDIWVAGPIGSVSHWDGARWEPRHLPTSADVASLAGGAGETWAQDSGGTVWRWRGGAWARGETRPPREHRGVWVLAPDDAWSCDDGAAFHWDGRAWRREVVDPAPASSVCVVWSDGTDVWFSDGASARVRNRGGGWDYESETSLVTAAGGDARNVWVGRLDGALQRLAKGRWYAVTRTRPRFGVVRLAGDDEATLRALTPASLFAFDGRGWFEAMAPARYYELHGAWPVGASDTWLAGTARVGGSDRGRASRWGRDAGERDVLDAPAPLRAVAASPDGAVWAVGDGGAAHRFDGRAWSATATGVTTALRDVWAPSRDLAWAVGDGGVALRWDGAAWSRTPVPVTADLARVHGRAADDAWAVGAEPAAGRSHVLRWDGAAWRRDTAGLPAGYAARGVWAAPDGRVWLAGTTVLRREGGVWNAEPSGVEATLQAVWGTRDGRVRVGGSMSAILVRRR